MLKDNYISMLESSFKENWNKPALSDYSAESYRYSELAVRILLFHDCFKKMGINQGDKIALLGKNTSNWATVYLSVISYGAIIVPILPDFKADDIQHIINHSESVIFFAGKWAYEMLDETKMPNLQLIISLDKFETLFSRNKNMLNNFEKYFQHNLSRNSQYTPNSFKLPYITNESIASIVYTSGTTGFSKGVILPHRSLSDNVEYARNHMPLKSGDKIVSFMPLAHSYGCAFEFLFPVSLGCHITFLSKIPSPKVILKAFDEIKPHLILSVPLIIEKIYKKQIKPVLDKPLIKVLLQAPVIGDIILNKIKKKLNHAFGERFHEIVIGGAPLNEEVEDFLMKIKFRFTTGYGMTECGPLISYCSWKEHKKSSVGFIVDSMKIKIDSPDPQKIVGEILIKGTNLMQGYYKNKEATDEVLIDGWLRTGDLGLIDKEGNIYIKGRSKNMILGPSGQNIYPEEIEAKLNNLPYIQESLVLEKDGRIIALVYPDFEMADKHGLKEKDLVNEMRKNKETINAMLQVYSPISSIEIYPEEFEKTPTKKIKRFLYKI